MFDSLIERLQNLERVTRSIGDIRSADRLEADIAKLKRVHEGSGFTSRSAGLESPEGL